MNNDIDQTDFITPAQLRCLEAVQVLREAFGAVSVRDIGEVLGTTTNDVQQKLNRLEHKGLIRRERRKACTIRRSTASRFSPRRKAMNERLRIDLLDSLHYLRGELEVLALSVPEGRPFAGRAA